MDFAQKCRACEFHANFIYQPPKPLHPIIALWPFDAVTKSFVGHLYILTTTNYFSKWVEVIPPEEVKNKVLLILSESTSSITMEFFDTS